MRSALKYKIISIVILGILFSLPLIGKSILFLVSKQYEDFNIPNENLMISTVSGKLHIDNNWTDTKTAGICTGKGTEDDPYVIEDFMIDAEGMGSCILIGNSTEHFRIENCTLSNCGSNFYDAGIKLMSTDNGELVGNQFSDPDGFGIILNNSNDNIITKNLVSAKRGISVRFSNDNLIYLNNLQNPIFNAEQHNSTGNKWSSPKKIKYVYNNRTLTKRLGNYWGGIGLPDNNNDGIGDTPVIFDQHLPSSEWKYIDYYPLIAKLANYEILGEVSEATISGYIMFIIIGVVSIISLVILKRLKNLKII